MLSIELQTPGGLVLPGARRGLVGKEIGVEQLTVNSPVGDFVVDVFGRHRIFQRLGIDFCCRGKQSLAEACQAAGADPHAVYAELIAYQVQKRIEPHNWNQAPLAELCDHIQSMHHGYLRREMPRIKALCDKVVEVHGQRHPGMRQVADIFASLASELESHLRFEEQVLFPAIRRMEKTGNGHEMVRGEPLDHVIANLENEHVKADDAMENLRNLTGNYTAPADACNAYRALMMALEDFQTDLHEHVHKENNILHPRALRLLRRNTHK